MIKHLKDIGLGLAVLILIAGCTPNNQVNQQQVSHKPLTQKQVNPAPVQISSHTRNAQPKPLSTTTQASSTSTFWMNGSRLSAKGTQDELPSELLDLLQPGTNNPAGQAPAPANNNGEQTSDRSGAGNNKGNQKDSSQFAQQVLDLVNKERSKAGLGSLTMDEELSKMAMAKAEDMYDNNYFDHNSPTHGSPMDMMKEYGITYNSAGENIAKGQTSPSQVMKDWMNSPGHKANILNKSYTKIGIAFYNNEWVQEFTG
ncbi:SCP-like extracellular [Paenibacillus glucanolyticus]|uniref:SCP-like extracellular n=1 Tax=Paenibacillus glucanolyticus TaxID=59843 RepID=A0A163LUT6_9BACL|nr:CAP domain-containing protein [Paenibacillus glucanolyticus]KZS48487.1 SCP-like extracellular [Paenibacillus glucanolyticus]